MRGGCIFGSLAAEVAKAEPSHREAVTLDQAAGESTPLRDALYGATSSRSPQNGDRPTDRPARLRGQRMKPSAGAADMDEIRLPAAPALGLWCGLGGNVPDDLCQLPGIDVVEEAINLKVLRRAWGVADQAYVVAE